MRLPSVPCGTLCSSTFNARQIVRSTERDGGLWRFAIGVEQHCRADRSEQMGILAARSELLEGADPRGDICHTETD